MPPSAGLGQTAAMQITVSSNPAKGGLGGGKSFRRLAQGGGDAEHRCQEMEVIEGTTILEACRRLGSITPTLCQLETLTRSTSAASA